MKPMIDLALAMLSSADVPRLRHRYEDMPDTTRGAAGDFAMALYVEQITYRMDAARRGRRR